MELPSRPYVLVYGKPESPETYEAEATEVSFETTEELPPMLVRAAQLMVKDSAALPAAASFQNLTRRILGVQLSRAAQESQTPGERSDQLRDLWHSRLDKSSSPLLIDPHDPQRTADACWKTGISGGAAGKAAAIGLCLFLVFEGFLALFSGLVASGFLRGVYEALGQSHSDRILTLGWQVLWLDAALKVSACGILDALLHSSSFQIVLLCTHGAIISMAHLFLNKHLSTRLRVLWFMLLLPACFIPGMSISAAYLLCNLRSLSARSRFSLLCAVMCSMPVLAPGVIYRLLEAAGFAIPEEAVRTVAPLLGAGLGLLCLFTGLKLAYQDRFCLKYR